MKRKGKKLTKEQARKRGLVSGRGMADSIFSGLDSRRTQQIGRTFGRQPRRGGR